MKIRIKAKAVPEHCIYRNSCQGTCAKCHDYSEALVGTRVRVQERYTLEDIANKLCMWFGAIECNEEICPAFDYCYKGHNGMIEWLRKVVQ